MSISVPPRVIGEPDSIPHVTFSFHLVICNFDLAGTVCPGIAGRLNAIRLMFR